MRITYTIRADCDEPPDYDYMNLNGDLLDRKLEDAVATFLMDAGASASVGLDVRIEP